MARRHKDVMWILLGDIVGGALVEGALLPRDADLAEQFDVSKWVAREAIRALEERGLVRVTHGVGAVVTSRWAWACFAPEVLAALRVDRALARRVFAEFLECRRIVEVEAAGLAAGRVTPSALDVVWEAFAGLAERAERAGSNAFGEREFHRAEVWLHRVIADASGNLALAPIVEPVVWAFAPRPVARSRARLTRNVREHRRIVRAISRHDSRDARAGMRAHLATIESYLAEY